MTAPTHRSRRSVQQHHHSVLLVRSQLARPFVKDFFRQSSLLKSAGLNSTADLISANSGVIDFSNVSVNSYIASVLADFLLRRLLQQQASFTMETVMSSADKVELLKVAQSRGYRTYLYFVATEDPAINVSRVQNRVRQGGHSVPEDKISFVTIVVLNCSFLQFDTQTGPISLTIRLMVARARGLLK